MSQAIAGSCFHRDQPTLEQNVRVWDGDAILVEDDSGEEPLILPQHPDAIKVLPDPMGLDNVPLLHLDTADGLTAGNVITDCLDD